jgi:hypothetical protein
MNKLERIQELRAKIKKNNGRIIEMVLISGVSIIAALIVFYIEHNFAAALFLITALIAVVKMRNVSINTDYIVIQKRKLLSTLSNKDYKELY